MVGGPGWQKTGWLVYIIDEAGNQLTDTKVFYSSSAQPSAGNGGVLLKYPATKFGGSTNGYAGGQVAEWEPKPPFSDGGGPNGIAVKNFMLQNDNISRFIIKHWGEGQLEAFISEKHFLIMEAFYWGQMYKGNSPTGIYLCATAHGWAHYQNLFNFGDYGSPRINRYTNNTFPNCVKLEFPQFGYTPGYGKMTNTQIMAGGNGFLSLWANEDIEIEDMEERDELKQLYAIKNWSDEFDISEGIPSGEPVMNAYEADSFYGLVEVDTVESDSVEYGATYTYKVKETDGTRWDPEKMQYVPNVTETTVATMEFSFSAKASYQVVKELELYSFDKLQVQNDAFSFYPEYTKENSEEWYDITTEVKRYVSDDDYTKEALLGIENVEESHYSLPEEDYLEDKTIYVDSAAEADERMSDDKEDAMESVYDESWSRNDRLVVYVGDKEYKFMTDDEVTGCIIEDYTEEGKGSAAESDYRYGGANIFLDSVEMERCKGEMEIIIPPSTDNLNYPTGVICVYKNIANTETEKDITLRAGRGMHEGDGVDDIYDHIIESDNSYGADHNRMDKPDGDGYDIKVHTPVISPIMITSALGTPQWYADEQLIDVDASVDFQLKLDTDYMIKWNLDQWISYKYGELTGYEQNGGFPSRYDKYVEKKEIKFPFDVYYEGVYYEKGEWIEVLAPNDYEALWDDGLSLEEKLNYQSNNHWQMMPIYIPSYAQEGSGTIEVKVYAYNVEGRYEGSHNVAEAMEVEMNTLTSSYIATYTVTDQLSGHIYGFTVTGVDDRDMYDFLDLEKSIWDRIGYSLCPTKEEKVPGTKNRHGEDMIRHQVDGSLSTFTKNPDGSYSPDHNLLPLRKGSNATAGLHTGDGRLWLGTGFGFNLKTIANLWGNNDYIEITPTFKFYAKDGSHVDTIRMDGDTPVSTNNRLILLYKENGKYKKFFDVRGQEKASVAMGDKKFNNSYYDTDVHLQDTVVKKYGNWIEYTLQRWNETNHLYGNAAKTRYEMMDRAWPCYTNINITLDKNLRMLSGEWEQLFKNRNRVNYDVATYFDFNEDGSFDENIPEETTFRDSMQTWYGGYCMPGKILVYDNINGDFYTRDNLSLADFSNEYEVIINFDIIAYQNGTPHLAYGGMINGGRVWEKEGYDNKEDGPTPPNPTPDPDPDNPGEDPSLEPEPEHPPYDDGDVVIYDLEKAFKDKLEGHLINVN